MLAFEWDENKNRANQTKHKSSWYPDGGDRI